MLQNVEAEAGLLGILITNNRSYDEFSDILHARHFATPQYAALFAYTQAEVEAGRRVTFISLQGKIEGLEQANLIDLSSAFLFENEARHYAQIIVDCYQRRELTALSKKIAAACETISAGEVIAIAEKGLLGLSQQVADQDVTAYDAAGEAFKWMEDIQAGRVTALKTDFHPVDRILGGLYGGRLYVLAGRPGMGKTALALNFADNIAKHTPCLFLSLEMTRQELSMRLLAMRTGIGVDQQQRASDLTTNDWNRLNEARSDLKDAQLVIYDPGKMDLIQIKTWARRFRRTRGRFALFIDYLGLMGMDVAIKNRVHQIEEITTGLKALAKELDIPIVLLSQLSRSLEQRDDKRPMLSDLRDSGSIEQDADAVLMCYREEYYVNKEKVVRTAKMKQETYDLAVQNLEYRKERAAGVCEVIVAKNRQGKDGTARLKFDGQFQRFTEK